MPSKGKKAGKKKVKITTKKSKPSSRTTKTKEYVDPVKPEVIIPPPTARETLVSLLVRQPVSEKEMCGVKLTSHLLQEFSPQEIRDLHIVFNAFDMNSDGLLHFKEVSVVLMSLGFKQDLQKTSDMMEAVALKKTNYINFCQFLECIFFYQGRSSKDIYEEIRKGFKALDLNQDGHLDLSDLEEAGENLGLKLTRHDYTEMIEDADKNGDGRVNLMEFSNIMLQTNLFFQSDV